MKKGGMKGSMEGGKEGRREGGSVACLILFRRTTLNIAMM